MLWLAAHRLVLIVGLVALLAGLGGGLALGPTHTRTTIVASTGSRTVTHTVVRTHTVLRPAPPGLTPPRPSPPRPAQAPAVPAPGGPPRPSAGASPGVAVELRYTGTGPRVLGTVTVRHTSMLRWTSSGGRFRLLFNRTGVAVDSTAHAGQTGAPAMTYTDVKIDAPGRWTVQIG